MGNCNCLKPYPLHSISKSDIKVDADINNSEKIIYTNNISYESQKKVSPRGVSNPTQNNIIKKMKKENSKISLISNNELDNQEKNEKTKYKENKESNLNNHNETNIDKGKNSTPGNKINIKLSDVLKIKDLSKLNKEKKDINIVLLGYKTVGKSSLIFQYTANKFDQYYITTILKEDSKKSINVDNKNYNLCFTVTSGDPQYQGDYTSYYKSADFFVLVYDVSAPQTFDKLKDIVNKDIIEYVCLYKKDYANVIFVGNKIDLKTRKVTLEEVTGFCDKYFFDHFEISAKNNLNISRIFSKIAEVYHDMITK